MWRIQYQQADCWRPIRASQTQPATSRRFACGNNGLFLSAALPIRVFSPLFNRYEIGMDFGSHVDNAIRTHVASGQHIRTDISVTLFLSAPEEYDGGELIIEDTFGTHSVRLAAGDAILYPAVWWQWAGSLASDLAPQRSLFTQYEMRRQYQ